MPRKVLSQALLSASLFALVACNAILGNEKRPLASEGSGGIGESAGTNASSHSGSAGKATRGGGSSGGSSGGIDDSAGEGAGDAAGMPNGSSGTESGGSSTAGSGGTLSGAGSVGIGGGGGKTGSGGSAGTGSPAGGSGGKPAGGAPGSGGSSTGGSTTGGAGGSGGTSPSAITVKLDVTHQTIQGFGLSSAKMPSNKTLPIDNLFGTAGADAIGLSILRVGMNSDGSLAGPFLAEARNKGANIIGSAWSPPASCKSNSKTQQGGWLVDVGTCVDAWATTLANFSKSQNLYAMSIGNEPDFASCAAKGPPCTDDFDSTTYTAKQMVAWVKVAGAKIKTVSPITKVIAPETAEWIHAWSNASGTGSTVSGHPQSSDPLGCGCFSNTPTATGCAQTCLDGNGYDYGHWLWNDQAAWSAFDIFGVHEYDSQAAIAWPADVNGGKPNKEIWQTEMSGLRYWPEEGPSTDINNGVVVAGWIHSALTVGEASAWLWSTYESYFQNDNEGLAVVQGTSTIAKRYYTLGNYSKFVRPTYVMVDITGNTNANVLLSAFKSPSGNVVVVAINKGAASANVTIAVSGGTAPATFTPYVTSATDNLKAATTVAVTGGSFTAVLPSKSVTTFVGN